MNSQLHGKEKSGERQIKLVKISQNMVLAETSEITSSATSLCRLRKNSRERHSALPTVTELLHSRLTKPRFQIPGSGWSPGDEQEALGREENTIWIWKEREESRLSLRLEPGTWKAVYCSSVYWLRITWPGSRQLLRCPRWDDSRECFEPQFPHL